MCGRGGGGGGLAGCKGQWVWVGLAAVWAGAGCKGQWVWVGLAAA